MDALTTLPRLNEPAPDFQAVTTHGTRNLSDYRGKWLILFFHTGAFTPVCTTEVLTFAKACSEFEKMNCMLMGVSTDSNASHIAWVRSIKDKFDIDINFPLASDLSMTMVQAYGSAKTCEGEPCSAHSTFFIDEKTVLRAMFHYPVKNGQSVLELKRLLSAMQTSDQQNVSTPEGWRTGEKVLLMSPQTTRDAEKRSEEGFDYKDWYFSKKDF